MAEPHLEQSTQGLHAHLDRVASASQSAAEAIDAVTEAHVQAEAAKVAELALRGSGEEHGDLPAPTDPPPAAEL